MKKLSITSMCAVLLFAIAFLASAPVAAQVYELRTYTTNEGKLPNLHARFRDHTVGLFDKHGMESIGYWVPVDEPAASNTLIYVLRHESRDAAKASWRAFATDPAWQKVAKESELDGRILAKFPESVYMEAADFSPALGAGSTDGGVFELRTYKVGEGKLGNLDARFRDHTIAIFDRFNMKSMAYWHPVDEPDSKDTLIYILHHESREAAAKAWQAFIADEEWGTVFAESRKDGPLLREAPGSVFLVGTDYSSIR